MIVPLGETNLAEYVLRFPLQAVVPSWRFTCFKTTCPAPVPSGVGSPLTAIVLLNPGYALPESQVLQADTVVLLNVCPHEEDVTSVKQHAKQIVVRINKDCCVVE